MKTRIQNLTTHGFWVTLLLASTTFAGTKEGGGGAGYVCPQLSPPKHVQLLDLAQGSAEKFIIPESQDPVRSQIDSAFKKIAAFSKDGSSSVFNDLERIFEKISDPNPKHLLWRTQGSRLAPPDDTGLHQIPEDCYLVGIAYYNDDSDQLTIDKRYYSQLTKTGKAGLWVHETLWWLERRFNAGDDSTKASFSALTLSSPTIQFPLLMNGFDPHSFSSGFIKYRPFYFNNQQKYYEFELSESSERVRAIVADLFAKNSLDLNSGNDETTPLAFGQCTFVQTQQSGSDDLLLPQGETICHELKTLSDRKTRSAYANLLALPAFRLGLQHGLVSVILEEDGETPYMIDYLIQDPGLKFKVTNVEVLSTVQECADKAKALLKNPIAFSINGVFFNSSLSDNSAQGRCRIDFTTVSN